MNIDQEIVIRNTSELRSKSVGEFVKHRPCKLFTLVIVLNGDKTLLGWKKRGFGVGKWNGFGGKVEPGETIIDAAKRELQEECGLIAKSLQKLGVLFFENASWEDSQMVYEVHLFTTTEFEGQIVESDEMIPKWFLRHEIPFEDMWASNKYWLPRAINGQSFDGLFSYENENTLIKVQIDEHKKSSL